MVKDLHINKELGEVLNEWCGRAGIRERERESRIVRRYNHLSFAESSGPLHFRGHLFFVLCRVNRSSSHAGRTSHLPLWAICFSAFAGSNALLTFAGPTGFIPLLGQPVSSFAGRAGRSSSFLGEKRSSSFAGVFLLCGINRTSFLCVVDRSSFFAESITDWPMFSSFGALLSSTSRRYFVSCFYFTMNSSMMLEHFYLSISLYIRESWYFSNYLLFIIVT